MIFIRNAFKNTFLFFCIVLISCGNGTKLSSQTSSEGKTKAIINKKTLTDSTKTVNSIIIGANRTELYLPLLQHKKVAIVGNQTSVIFKNDEVQPYTHIVDSLIAQNINIVKVFAPEHGFRGKADAAELVADGKDVKTGIPIISLYSKNKKPTVATLTDVELMVFDIQDVGVRFYTYISTLHYVMQACAENNIPLVILDRPNPNAHYIDGPTLEPEHSSFIGMHPIPLVHGMTIGEYAQMINGEKWLGEGLSCDISIIPVKNYNHNMAYSIPIRPSPNLPNDKSINLYPSLGFFEGTTINAGRGTETQFQIFGSPDLPIDKYNYAYTPKPNFGAKYPKHQGEVCYGKNLQDIPNLKAINLEWLVYSYKHSNNKEKFFNTKSFTLHAGTQKLQQQIQEGWSVTQIKKSWRDGLIKYKAMRKKYLLYQ